MSGDLLFRRRSSAGTLALSWGRYGGFYVHRHRICLGWVAVTHTPVEIDDLMRAYADLHELGGFCLGPVETDGKRAAGGPRAADVHHARPGSRLAPVPLRRAQSAHENGDGR